MAASDKSKTASPLKTKPAQATSPPSSASNVFSNDGSFLARFQQMKAEEGKTKEAAALKRKREMEERVRNRGKRRVTSAEKEGEEEAKKEHDKRDSQGAEKDGYLEEVRKLERSSLKDKGAGVRALIK